MESIIADQDLVILTLNYHDGDYVEAGSQIIQAEILKMMVSVQTPVSGKIEYNCKPYDFINRGELLAEIIYVS